MGKIHQLNGVLADQIAAGEVIERPASIVKELVENSLDANSRRIDVLVADAGISEIRVIDDGSGIAADDVPMAFKRHATSKISSEHDLFNVKTMGFRGEALPSIASVADVQMDTAVEGAAAGTHIHIKGGQTVDIKPAPARRGTDIRVADLFYNTPARLKYLKAVRTELSRVVDIVNRLALANPHVAISLTSNGRELFRSAGNGNLQQVIAAIYGIKVGRKMVHVHAADADFEVDGYTSLPELTRSSRNYITLTINHRYVRNFALTKAVTTGYSSKLMVGRYPVAVVNIKLDPLLVDVNVHPAKREVRLSKEDQLTKLISQAIFDRLAKENLIPDVGETALSQNQVESLNRKLDEVSQPYVVSSPQSASPQSAGQSTSEPAQAPVDEPQSASSSATEAANPAAAGATDAELRDPVVITSRDQLSGPRMAKFDAEFKDEDVQPFDTAALNQPEGKRRPQKVENVDLQIDDQGSESERRFPQLEYIGQVHGTFLLAQASDGLYIVDQHAAQERINFEYFRKAVAAVSPAQQTFLTPLVLQYSTADALKLADHLDVLAGVGIKLEPFGDNAFILNSHPTWFAEGQEEATAKEMIAWVINDGKITLEQFREKTAAMMSCKRAIKANHHLDARQATALLHNLSKCQNPFNCPHGRPVTIHFTDSDLEKLFKRIQDTHEPYANEFDDHDWDE